MRRVLLGIDFIGDNWHAALSSIERWWEFVSTSAHYWVLVGVSNFCQRQEILPGSVDVTPDSVHRILTSFIPADRLTHWTSDIDGRVLVEAQRQGCRSVPLYSAFNYGSIVNRLILMAHAKGCEYLVRIDPGTCPPEGVSFDALMSEHERSIDDNTYAVVSRQYAGRLALRHMFAKEGRELAHTKLVRRMTGVHVDAQITGGAMFTQRMPGVPAVCFPPPKEGLTLVWASDDGIYQTLKCTKAHCRVLQSCPVPRFDSVGKIKGPLEYYRGIVGAAFLHSLENHASRRKAEGELDHFMDELKAGILDESKCSHYDGNSDWATNFCLRGLAPSDFLDAIEIGYANHTRLLSEWDGIADALRPLVRDLV